MAAFYQMVGKKPENAHFSYDLWPLLYVDQSGFIAAYSHPTKAVSEPRKNPEVDCIKELRQHIAGR